MGAEPDSTALILIDHGSRLDEANKLIERIAERIRERGRFSIVEIAHMEIAEPTLDRAFTRCVERGAKRIVIVPYFLASGNHVTNDIPRLAAEAAAKHAGIEWKLAEPLGLDERLVDVVLARAEDGKH